MKLPELQGRRQRSLAEKIDPESWIVIRGFQHEHGSRSQFPAVYLGSQVVAPVPHGVDGMRSPVTSVRHESLRGPLGSSAFVVNEGGARQFHCGRVAGIPGLEGLIDQDSRTELSSIEVCRSSKINSSDRVFERLGLRNGNEDQQRRRQIDGDREPVVAR